MSSLNYQMSSCNSCDSCNTSNSNHNCNPCNDYDCNKSYKTNIYCNSNNPSDYNRDDYSEQPCNDYLSDNPYIYNFSDNSCNTNNSSNISRKSSDSCYFDISCKCNKFSSDPLCDTYETCKSGNPYIYNTPGKLDRSCCSRSTNIPCNDDSQCCCETPRDSNCPCVYKNSCNNNSCCQNTNLTSTKSCNNINSYDNISCCSCNTSYSDSCCNNSDSCNANKYYSYYDTPCTSNNSCCCSNNTCSSCKKCKPGNPYIYTDPCNSNTTCKCNTLCSPCKSTTPSTLRSCCQSHNSYNSCDYCNSCNPRNSCNSCEPCDCSKSHNSCDPCDSYNSCNSCNPCDSCNSYNPCNSCESCTPCDSCNCCNSCNSCESCNLNNSSTCFTSDSFKSSYPFVEKKSCHCDSPCISCETLETESACSTSPCCWYSSTAKYFPRPLIANQSCINPYPNTRTKYDNIILIAQNNFNDFFCKANVIGLGLGYIVTNGSNTGRLGLQVYVTKKLPLCQVPCQDRIPKVYCGFETDVVETGRFSALSFTKPCRPATGGYGIGPCCQNYTGTLGCMVTNGCCCFILSTNHVLANGNALPVGTSIVQPSAQNGGSVPCNQVATLSKFLPINFLPQIPTPTIPNPTIPNTTISNTVLPCWPNPFCPCLPSTILNDVDAAIAQISNPSVVCPNIALIGKIRGVSDPQLNLNVKKTGAITEFSTGRITGVGATILVDYDNDTKCALFRNQIVTSSMGSAGDSGSLILDDNNYAVGLLFAGGLTHSLSNPICTVLDALDVQIVNG